MTIRRRPLRLPGLLSAVACAAVACAAVVLAGCGSQPSGRPLQQQVVVGIAGASWPVEPGSAS